LKMTHAQYKAVGRVSGLCPFHTQLITTTTESTFKAGIVFKGFYHL